ILVDDGSVDKTVEKVVEKRGGDEKIKIIALTRNFGKELALTAGLDYATGDAVIMIDADGQHPVEIIPQMIKKWEEGAYVVTAVRGENTTRHKMGSRIYYRVMRICGNKDIVVGAMDYRLLDRSVVDEFNKMPEHNRLARGLVDWLGYPQEYVKVHTKNRLDGKPTYSHKKLVTLTIDGLASSSRTPLVLFGYIGVAITVVSLILGVFILIQQYILGDPLKLDWSGAVAMSVFVSFLVGLVLVSQAITALYISQIHTEAKGRPLYVVDKRKSIGLKNDKK
ncbi:MAG: glycosyltransferase family 2 protein, partial [Candidatus Saccharimonadaceae bacterium]|nr:glycosyltransferase family 2 protein [Candidatus Saccharimonadaceae bacterium]